MDTIAPEQREKRIDAAYWTVRTLLTMGRPPKASSDWEPSLERIIEMTYLSDRVEIDEADAAAGLQRLHDESAAYVRELTARASDDSNPQAAQDAKRALKLLREADAEIDRLASQLPISNEGN